MYRFVTSRQYWRRYVLQVVAVVFLAGFILVTTAWAWAGPPGQNTEQQQQIVVLQHKVGALEQMLQWYQTFGPKPSP